MRQTAPPRTYLPGSPSPVTPSSLPSFQVVMGPPGTLNKVIQLMRGHGYRTFNALCPHNIREATIQRLPAV